MWRVRLSAPCRRGEPASSQAAATAASGACASGGRAFALKQYPSRADDPRDRLVDRSRRAAADGALSTSIRFRACSGVDSERGYALLSWIDGSDVAEVGDADIDAAVAFLSAIHGLRGTLGRRTAAGIRGLPVAARRSSARSKRGLARLAGAGGEQPELLEFIDIPGCRLPSRAEAGRAARAEAPPPALILPLNSRRNGAASSRPISASTTACAGAMGRLAFVDFEYFGWDDPVKLTADILLHPGWPLPPTPAQAVPAGGGAAVRRRWRRSRSGCGLSAVVRSCAGCLSCSTSSSPSAGSGACWRAMTGSWSEAKARQLARARKFLSALPEKLEE